MPCFINKTPQEQESILFEQLEKELKQVDFVIEGLQDQIDALNNVKNLMRQRVGTEIARVYENNS